MFNKQFKAQHVWYNPRTQDNYRVKMPNCWVFDSISEFECFKMLRDRLPGFLIQPQTEVYIMGGKSWKVDFCIGATNRFQTQYLSKLVGLLNETEINKPLSRFYLEYKGQMDDNFLDKMQCIADNDPELYAELVILSHSPTAIVTEDLTTLDRKCKLVSSVEYFKKTLCEL